MYKYIHIYMLSSLSTLGQGHFHGKEKAVFGKPV